MTAADRAVTPPGARQWIVPLPYVTVPLSLNDRLHWRVKHQRATEIRSTTAWCVRAARIPLLRRVHVRLIFTPPDRRIRDRDNIVGTSKPAYDGVVVAGVVVDDDPVHMDQAMPVIEPVRRGDLKSRLRLVITELPHDPTGDPTP